MPILTPTVVVVSLGSLMLVAFIVRYVLGLPKISVLVSIGLFMASGCAVAAVHVFVKVFIYEGDKAALGVFSDDYWTLFIGAGINMFVAVNALWAAITYNPDKASQQSGEAEETVRVS